MKISLSFYRDRGGNNATDTFENKGFRKTFTKTKMLQTIPILMNISQLTMETPQSEYTSRFKIFF